MSAGPRTASSPRNPRQLSIEVPPAPIPVAAAAAAAAAGRALQPRAQPQLALSECTHSQSSSNRQQRGGEDVGMMGGTTHADSEDERFATPGWMPPTPSSSSLAGLGLSMHAPSYTPQPSSSSSESGNTAHHRLASAGSASSAKQHTSKPSSHTRDRDSTSTSAYTSTTSQRDSLQTRASENGTLPTEHEDSDGDKPDEQDPEKTSRAEYRSIHSSRSAASLQTSLSTAPSNTLSVPGSSADSTSGGSVGLLAQRAPSAHAPSSTDSLISSRAASSALSVPLFSTSPGSASSGVNGMTDRPAVASPVVEGPRAAGFAEGEAMFVSEATGYLGRYSSENSRAAIGRGHATASTSGQQNSSSPRKGFLSTLLHRSSSYNGRTSSSSVQGQASSTAPSSRPASQLPSRCSSSIGTYANEQPCSSSNAAHHTRHNSNPPSPALNAARQRRTSQNVRAPSAHDAVFSRPADSEDGPHPPYAASANASPNTSRAQRIRSHFAPLAPSSNANASTSVTPHQSEYRFPHSSSASALASGSRSGSPAVQSARAFSTSTSVPSALHGHPNMPRSISYDASSASNLKKEEGGRTPPSLESIGLSLLPLSPSLSLGRYGQPLCGAVLDGKYLLIGTTLGLDFLPLHRPGNRSMKAGLFERLSLSASASVSGLASGSSSTLPDGIREDHRTRKPIPLIKKTRFKQLVVLDRRSNVLLAVAGRNDHVRVYALDSLRKLIEKKMREIDEKEGHASLPRSGVSSGNMAASAAIKGKGRAMTPSPVPPALPLHQQQLLHATNLRSQPHPPSSAMRERTASQNMAPPLISPPPAYTYPDPTVTAGTDAPILGGRRRSSASSGVPTPRNRRFPRGTGPSSTSTSPAPPSLALRRSSSKPASPVPSPPSTASSHREFHASSPRALRRPKSRENVRRGSTSASGLPGTASMSRRGSAATVTPHTVAALNNASSGTAADGACGDLERRRGSGASLGRMTSEHVPPTPGVPEQYRAQVPPHGACTNGQDGSPHKFEESYEWVDSAELDALDRQAPTIPQNSITPSTSYASSMPTASSVSSTLSAMSASFESGMNRHSPAINAASSLALSRARTATAGSSGSGVSRASSRMTPRSPIANAHNDTEDSSEDATGDADGAAQVASRGPNRRVSLAEALRESRVPAPVMTRSASANVTSTVGQRNGMPRSLSSMSSRPMPRSATTTSDHNIMGSLADFLRAGPPPSPSSRTLGEMPDRDVHAISPAIPPEDALADGAPTGKDKNRLFPRSPVLQQEMEQVTSGLSMLDFIRAGPPDPSSVAMAPDSTGRSASTSSDSGVMAADHARKAKILSKPQRPPSTQDITAGEIVPVVNDSADPAPLAPVSMTRSRAMPSFTTVASEIDESRASLPNHRQRTATSPEINMNDGSVIGKAAKRMSLQPRAPVARADVSDEIGNLGNANMPRSLSLQEALDAVLDEVPSSPAGMAGLLQRSPTQLSTASNGDNTSTGQTGRRHRKRWSILEGLRAPSSPVMRQGATSSPLVPSGSETSHTSASAAPSPVIHQSSTSRTRQVSGTSATGGSDGRPAAPARSDPSDLPIKRRPVNLEEDSPPFANLIPEGQESTNPDGTTITFTGGDEASADIAGDRSASATGPNGAPQPAQPGALEYVKLARTKGSRFIRASETAKRTYLAVLCGEQGERIELFTGAKNVSLSLNRTFVLPETPRTIEFQLQGEDLLDLYLIYDSAIFALEPSTVRVREVGIQRNERRTARRERERLAREADALEVAVSQGAGRGGTASNSQSDTEPEQVDELPPPPLTPLQSEAPRTRAAEPTVIPQRTDNAAAPENVADGVSGADSSIPYTTFQQLEYLPPLPASVLGTSYIIPPTYDSVLSASPMPGQEGFANTLSPGERALSPPVDMLAPETFQNAMHTPHPNNTPLLSPVSLLANPTARTPGPPGLFFVSKGRHLTGIVDGEGRSVIKKPFSWLSPDLPAVPALEHAQGLDIFTRMEVLLVQGKTRVCLVAFGPSAVRATEMGGPYEHSLEVIPQDAHKRRIKSNASMASSIAAKEPEDAFIRDVTYLSKTSESSFFAERVGNSIVIHSLAAIGL